MAKKTTKKKAPKTAKVAKKAAPKKAAGKKAAPKKAAPKKAVAGKKSPAKKPVTKKAAAKSKLAPKKTTRKKAVSTRAKIGAVSPANNGKAVVNPTAQPPAPTRRVVRPVPPPPAEPVIEDWTTLSDAKLRKVKTDLTRKDLNTFKRLLLEKRAEIVGDVLNMEDARHSGNGGDLSNMPLHMADIGSDNYEQEFTLGLVESERKLLVEIDAALMRIKNRTYGVCIVTGTPIPKARLEIKPWAKYGIDIVREREKRGLHSF